MADVTFVCTFVCTFACLLVKKPKILDISETHNAFFRSQQDAFRHHFITSHDHTPEELPNLIAQNIDTFKNIESKYDVVTVGKINLLETV